MGKLTVFEVKNAKTPGRYSDGNGLSLYVKSRNSRSWVLRIQARGRRHDIGLGSASEVGLQDARERALEIRKQLRSGLDPIAARRASEASTAAIPTFREAAIAAHKDLGQGWRNGKHKAQWISTLETYAFPAIGKTRVDQVDGPMVRDLLLPIWLAIPETARRVKQRVGAVLDWAHIKGFRGAEAPLRSLAKGLPRQPKNDRHYPALSYEHVPALMPKLRQTESVGRLALQFLILTAARSGEVRGAMWDEIDLDEATWTVPAERMKANKTHVVPLSLSALAVLEAAKKVRTGRPQEPIFPGVQGRKMSDMTLTAALRRVNGMSATVHGFRSSFRDWAAEQTSVQGEIVETALAHAIPNKVEAAYRRTNFLEKRRRLMDDWAKFIT
jgi:integrase